MIDAKFRRLARVGVVGIAVLGMFASGPAAAAHPRHDRDRHRLVAVRGHCSGESVWRLVLVQHGPKITVGFSVRSGVAGEVWRVRMAHGHFVFFADLVETNDHGSFGIRRPTRNTPGLDFYRAGARNLETGETCLARSAI